jgi:hypothetical protein
MKNAFSNHVFSREFLAALGVLVGIFVMAEAGISPHSLMLVVALAAAYFLPTIVARSRRVPNQGSVAVINTFLGWTFIGSVVALAMAARSRSLTR